MPAKVQKWGNSLGVRIPKSVIEKMNLSENAEVDIEHKNGSIVITPVKNKFSLDALVEQITPSNLHQEDQIFPEGGEVW